MQYGQGQVTPYTLPNPATPGPPFPITSANNGLSVDVGTGKIVLGNDAGGSAAQLLSAREIKFNGNKLTFIANAGETIGIDGSNGVFPTMYNILNRNTPATGSFSRNLSGGTSAGIFDSVFNDIGSNITFGCMSAAYNIANSYAGNMPFVQANNNLQNASLSFLSQNGFYWTPFGNNNINQSAMRMFQSGNLQLNVIGTNPFTDSGERLQVVGTTRTIEMIITPTTLPAATNHSLNIKAEGNGSTDGFYLETLNGTEFIQIGAGRIKSTPILDLSSFLNGVTISPAATQVALFNSGGLEIDNAGHNAKITMNGTPGFTGTVTPVTSITVKGGIVTAVS